MISKLVYIAQAFSNDLKYFYTHTYGIGFEKIQSLAKSLYTELDTEIVELTSLAIQNGEDIDNMTNIKSYIDMDTEWTSVSKWSDINNAFDDIDKRIIKYIQYLAISNINTELKQVYINYWKSFDFNIEKETMLITSNYNTLK